MTISTLTRNVAEINDFVDANTGARLYAAAMDYCTADEEIKSFGIMGMMTEAENITSAISGRDMGYLADMPADMLPKVMGFLKLQVAA